MILIELGCEMGCYKQLLLFLLLFHIPKVMLTDHAVEDGNANSGPGENDEKKEQGKKVSCLHCILYSWKDTSVFSLNPLKKCIHNVFERFK